MRPIVIAIAGVAGSGKTALARALAAKLHAQLLHFDDFSSTCRWWPAYEPGPAASDGTHYRRWIAEGAQPDHYVSAPAFAAAIREAREQAQDSGGVVIVEEPWGRARSETGQLIDFVVFLKLSLDVALCRRLMRHHEQGADVMAIVHQYHQLRYTDYYMASANAASSSADLVVDALRPLDEIVETVLSQLPS